ncbi:MAG: hypothetical protein M3R36_05605 [Bacteroidota bacterium]|nr:hypothetical protein [Bacteroidota bacterium]
MRLNQFNPPFNDFKNRDEEAMYPIFLLGKKTSSNFNVVPLEMLFQILPAFDVLNIFPLFPTTSDRCQNIAGTAFAEIARIYFC